MNRRWIFRSFRITVILLIAFIAAACQPGTLFPQPPQPVPPGGSVPNTGIIPSVTVNDQEVVNNQVVVADVESDGPGWMVIHNQKGGGVGVAIGFTRLNSGDNKNVVVKIDPAQRTEVMYAMLHLDKGKVGTYEFPGPDVPVVYKGQMVTPGFRAEKVDEYAKMPPTVIIKNQVVNQGKVVISEVDTPAPAWIAIHVRNPDGSPGKDIGYTAVKQGKNINVVVTVDPTKVSPVMFAMLHKDEGEVGTYEFPGPDGPVELNGVMVAPTFATNTTDQTVKTASTPMTSDMGHETNPTATQKPASPPPTAAIAPTATQKPPAPAAPAGPTATTASMGGMDMGNNSSPAAQPPSNTPYIKVANQPITNSQVIVAEVNTTTNAWLVIHRQNGDGSVGGMVGYILLKPGNYRNVYVTVDTTLTSDTMLAMLHADKGMSGRLEYPGPDEPIMLPGGQNAIPFAVTYERTKDVVINLDTSMAHNVHLVDGRGMSLYNSSNDSRGQSNCTGDCLTQWRPLIITGRVIAGTGVQVDNLGFIVTSDGAKWVTYAGLPVYYYNGDNQPGDMKGQNMDGVWFLVIP